MKKNPYSYLTQSDIISATLGGGGESSNMDFSSLFPTSSPTPKKTSASPPTSRSQKEKNFQSYLEKVAPKTGTKSSSASPEFQAYLNQIAPKPITSAQPGPPSLLKKEGSKDDTSTSLEDEAITALLKLNTSTRLEIDELRISVNAARTIIAWLKDTTITSILFRNNKMEYAEFSIFTEALESNKTVTTLALDNNKVGDQGAKALATLLKKNIYIEKLSVIHSNMSSTGATLLALTLMNHPKIAIVDLSHNTIGTTGAQALAKVFKQNTSIVKLILTNNPDISDRCLKSIELHSKINEALAEVFKVQPDTVIKAINQIIKPYIFDDDYLTQDSEIIGSIE